MSAQQTVPPGIRTLLRDRRRVALFSGLALGLLLAELDQSVFATALPAIAGDLNGVDRLFWVNTAFIVTGTVAMPFAGRLGDRYGRRVVYLSGLAVFVAGSLLGALAPDLNTLLVARAVQGLGGGGLLVLIQATVADLLRPEDRAYALSGIDVVFALAALLGPPVGGLLADGAGWRWAFWINLPVGAIAILAAWLWLPRDTPATRPSPAPLLPLGLLARPQVAIAIAAGLVSAAALFGTVGYLPTYLQMAAGLTPTRAGLLMLSLVAGLGLATVGSAWYVRRTGAFHRPPPVGCGLAALALVLLATLPLGAGLAHLGAVLLLLGAGIGCCWESLLVLVQRAAPADQTGAATGLNAFGREIGVLIGTVGVGAAFTARLSQILAERLPAGGSPTTNRSDDLLPGGSGVDLLGLTPARLAALPEELQWVVAGAYHDALLPVIGAMIPLVVLSGLGLLRMPRS